MAIMLGDLSIRQIQDRCGIEFPDNVIEYLRNHHSVNAKFDDGAELWHGFDIPFCVYCGNETMARWLLEQLSPLDWSKCKESLQIQFYRGKDKK